jgi:hypothetical protein
LLLTNWWNKFYVKLGGGKKGYDEMLFNRLMTAAGNAVPASTDEEFPGNHTDGVLDFFRPSAADAGFCSPPRDSEVQVNS